MNCLTCGLPFEIPVEKPRFGIGICEQCGAVMEFTAGEPRVVTQNELVILKQSHVWKIIGPTFARIHASIRARSARNN
jgi:hypothetical protein